MTSSTHEFNFQCVNPEEVGQQFARDHGAKIDQSKLLNDVFTSA